MKTLRRGVARLTRRIPHFRGKARVIRFLDRLIPGRTVPMKATVDGVTYSLSSEDLIGREVLYRGGYQPDVVAACDRIEVQLRDADRLRLVFELSRYRNEDRTVGGTDFVGFLESLGFDLYKLGPHGSLRSLDDDDVVGDVVATKRE